jgi:hypothetical protein
MIEQTDRRSLPLCRFCGERIELVGEGKAAVWTARYGDWVPNLEPELCRGRRILGEGFKFDGHVLSTLNRPAVQ